MQGPYEPTERDTVIERLQTVPCLSRRRHIDQRKQYARDNLEHQNGERGAAENIEPARGLPRNLVEGHLTNGCAELQSQIEPIGGFLD